MTLFEFLEVEYISINAKRCIVRSLDEQCNATVWFDGDVSDGNEVREAGYNDDGDPHEWYDTLPILWIQTEGDTLVVEVDEEVE